MKVLIAVGSLTLAAGLLVPVLPMATAGVAETCDGQPATLVGVPGQERLDGTTGPDVIISNGARLVYAAEGEDVVCLTNGDASVILDGYLEYDNTSSWADDRVIGTTGNDRIISGAGAVDYFDIGQTEENGDVLSLGTGDSTITMDGVSVGSIDGGTGRDRLFARGSSDQLTVAVDSSVTFSGHPSAALDGIESFHLEDASFDNLMFTGSATSESLYTHGAFSEYRGRDPRAVTIALGGSNDIVTLGANVEGTVAGGPGNDQFRYTTGEGAPRRVTITLKKDAVQATGLRADVSSVDRLYSNFRNVSVVGDGQRNDVSLQACTARVRAAGGNDRVAIAAVPTCGGEPHVLNGGPGRDQLFGGRGRDLLIGGPGRDQADGGAGSDRCVAEVRRNCER